jgi:Phage capsid protein
VSQFVTTHYVQQYTTNIALLSQQRGSRLAASMTIGSYVGKQGVPVEQFAPTVATKRTTRYPTLTPADTQTDRRWVFPSDYDWNDLIDSIDKLRMLIDPQSSYVVNGTAAMERAKDDEIIAAYFGTAKTGPDGSTSTTFPASQQVSASEGASSATGMNVEKLKAGIQILLANEAWDPSSGERITCVITAKQNRNLMDEVQVINADYNGEKAVVNDGFVMQWGKVDFIHSERLPLNGSSQTRVPMYTKTGMHLGIWNDINSDVSQRKDLAGLPYQVYLYGTFGSTRIEEKKVVELPCA